MKWANVLKRSAVCMGPVYKCLDCVCVTGGTVN